MSPRSDYAESPFPFRILIHVLVRPILTLTIISIGVALLGLLPKSGELYLFGAFLLPWLAIGLGVLTLPFIGAAVSRFRLSEATKRNHALEHGTIFFLKQRYGKRAKLSGQSDDNGFRVAGSGGERDIREAFEELLGHLSRGDYRPTVAKKCGSLIVITQAIGLLLLSCCSVSFWLRNPNSQEVFLTLSVVLAIVMVIRYPVGMWVQERRFLSVTFSEAVIESIAKQSRARLLERHPVFYVRTWVR